MSCSITIRIHSSPYTCKTLKSDIQGYATLVLIKTTNDTETEVCNARLVKWTRAWLTFTEEHVPDTQHGGPGQGAGEGTHEPLCHVEDGVDLVLLQVLVGHCGDPAEEGKQDLPIQLNRLLQGSKETQQNPAPQYICAKEYPWIVSSPIFCQ